MAETGTGAGGGAPSAKLPTIVHFELEPVMSFALNATEEYQKCLDSRVVTGAPTHRPRASALLFGRFNRNEIIIGGIEFVPDIRGTDETVIAEFEDTIAPQFGDAYRNLSRGFWSDEKAVLRAIMRQDEYGRELVGSIHSHPDWQNIGPVHERRMRLSENPTQMDEYLFRQSCWPVNVIWYISGGDRRVTHRVAGWRSRPNGCDRLDLGLPTAIRETFEMGPPTTAGGAASIRWNQSGLAQGEKDMSDPQCVVTVKLPTAFHSLTGGRRRIQVEGGTVREVLIGLDQLCPGVLDRLVDQKGAMQRYVNVYRNENDIRGLEGLETRVAHEDQIWILPAVAGGSAANPPWES